MIIHYQKFDTQMDRRKFIRNTGIVAGIGVLQPNIFAKNLFGNDKKNLKIGIIGVGMRGRDHVDLITRRSDCELVAISDISQDSIDKTLLTISENGAKIPKIYLGDEKYYQKLLENKDIDAVIIATPWIWHTPMSIDAMAAGKAVGCEVGGAYLIEECWQIVQAFEKYQTPFMPLENVCYRRDVMAILNMHKKGLFGELIHCEGGYQHDLRDVKFNNGKQPYGGGVEFGENGYSEAKWRTENSVHRNGELYPTHGLGPVATFLDLERGNRMTHLTSMASKSRGLHNYIVEQGGKEHPNAKVEFKLGDVVTTMIKTVRGETITLTHDTSLPRPYSLGFRVQGTKGLWMDINKSVYLEGISKDEKWEDAKAYYDKYDHPLWQRYAQDAKGAGHGGMDWFVINAFIEALKNEKPMPLDVYDYATWSAITPLSEKSIELGSQAVDIPDFSKGRWMRQKNEFGLSDKW
jgi:hypothetical protein